MTSEIPPSERLQPEKQLSKKEKVIKLGKQAWRLYRKRPTTIDILLWTSARTLPIILGGTVIVSVIDISFDLDVADRMATVQTDPNAHPLVQLGQDFTRTIGEESIPFEKELEQIREELINGFSTP